MKRGFKPVSILFYLLSLLVSFIIGVYLAGILGAGEGQMLAAAAIVLGWGVLVAFVGLIISFIIVRALKHTSLVKANWILLCILAILYGVTHFRYLERQRSECVN